MALDISYFEQGYIDQRYFNRQADAEARLDASTSQQALSTKFRRVTSSVSAATIFNADGFEITVAGTRTTLTIVGNING